MVRRASGIRKVGHAGTLDPMATGVVVVGVGRATRLLRYVQEGTKEYVAVVRFGIGTDTLDADGREVSRQPMPIDKEQLEAAMKPFRGEISQVPPMFSAVKIGGDRLHELARAGKEVDREPRQVSIFRLELDRFEPGDYPSAVIEIECSKGTYIRSLADDIARAMGGRAHLEGLRRTRVGSFTIEQAMSVDELDAWATHLLEPVAAVADMPRIVASAEQMRAVASGRALESETLGELAVVDPNGHLLGVYEARDGLARASVVLS
jgi:tRNA pseudouridine55 synthase